MEAEVQFRREGEARSEARHATHHAGEVGPEATDSVRGIVTDLSSSGFRFLPEQPLEPDTVVWLKLGGQGPFMARVVWYDGTAAGCAFAGRLHPDQVAALLK